LTVFILFAVTSLCLVSLYSVLCLYRAGLPEAGKARSSNYAENLNN
jgi:hypothetical protein